MPPIPYAYATPQTEIGVAIETTRGTYAPPVYWLKIKNPKYKPDLTFNPDETLQGSMVKVYNLVSGLRYDAHGWDSYPYMDTFPVLVRGLLGSADTVTAAPTSTTLAAPATAQANSVSLTATVAPGSFIVIDAGTIGPNGQPVLETHQVTTVSGGGPFTANLAYPLLYAHAGGATVTGLTKHKMGLLNNAGNGNQSPTLSLTDYAGDQWRGMTAGTVDALTLKGTATGIVDYSTNLFCNAATTPSTPTASFTNVQAQPGWSTQILIGGSPITYYVDWEFDLKRGTKPIPALTGSQQYLLYFQGALESMGKIRVLLQNGSPELAAYEAGTIQSFDFTTYDVSNGNALNLHSTLVQFKTTGGIDRSKEWVEVDLDMQLLPSATDAVAGGVSPIVITAANGQSTAY